MTSENYNNCSITACSKKFCRGEAVILDTLSKLGILVPEQNTKQKNGESRKCRKNNAEKNAKKRRKYKMQNLKMHKMPKVWMGNWSQQRQRWDFPIQTFTLSASCGKGLRETILCSELVAAAIFCIFKFCVSFSAFFLHHSFCVFEFCFFDFAFHFSVFSPVSKILHFYKVYFEVCLLNDLKCQKYRKLLDQLRLDYY